MKRYFPRSVCILLGCAILFFAAYRALSSHALGVGALFCAWAFFFLAALRIVNRIANLSSGSLSQWIHWIHAMVFEVFAVLAVFFVRQLRFIRTSKEERGNGIPILLVHGYLHDRSAWIYHKKKLLLHGFGPVYTISLGYPFLSIMEYVKIIEQKALQIEKETGRKELILIGHSMGGLISSLYATKFAPSGKVTDVITIGSPLAGTPVAKIAIGPDAREMEKGSELVKGLQEAVRSAKGIRFYHIATKTDQLVVPYTSAIIEGRPERQLILEDVGHASLLYSPRVSEKILFWLKRPNG